MNGLQPPFLGSSHLGSVSATFVYTLNNQFSVHGRKSDAGCQQQVNNRCPESSPGRQLLLSARGYKRVQGLTS